MGCVSATIIDPYESLDAATKQSKANQLSRSDIDAAWLEVVNQAPKVKPINQALTFKRSTWKTVRIFVSSTFKDFDSEREILVKKIFPDLRIWCEARRIHLIECDLRWGVPLNSSSEAPLRSCLGEIDRCFSENVMPFFVNMIGERIGWIPLGDEVPDWVKNEYHWVDGLSMTEMEIMHAAYRNENPNALFLTRDRSFLKTVPPELQRYYIDENPIAEYKCEILKKMLQKRFKSVPNRLIHYKCKFEGIDPVTKWPRLTGLDDVFAKAVFKFFQDRIASQYPLEEDSAKLDPLDEARSQHESFMKLQFDLVVGRDPLIDELISTHVIGVGDNPQPVLISGGPGLGKSSIMCALAQNCLKKNAYHLLPKPKRAKEWTVFYHFVGAISGSTDLQAMLHRLLVEIGALHIKAKPPKDLEEAMGMVRGVLSKDSTNDCIIVIDAINQLDDVRGQVAPIAWLPTKLSPTVRLFVSAIPESVQSQRIQRDLGDAWNIVQLQPLDRETKEYVVSTRLNRFNKVLDSEQMRLLMSKQASDNPMWLTLAAEELRIFGQVRQLTSKIQSIPDGLFELENDILARFEREGDAALLVATLCFLECSVGGLLESELVELLAVPNLIPKQLSDLVLSKNDVVLSNISEPLNHRDSGAKRITAVKWADVYRQLRSFLRPFGSSGEGRLDFYHRSLSKVVRKRYFSRETYEDDSQTTGEIEQFFSRRLADYFSSKGRANLERRIQEYPSAAYHCNDLEGLKSFLSDWEVFDAVYSADFSSPLSQGWALVHDLDKRKDPTKGGNIYALMEETYMDAVPKLSTAPGPDKPKQSLPLPQRLERIAQVLMQNGCGSSAAKVAEQLVRMADKPDNAYDVQKLLIFANYVYLKATIIDEDLRVHDYWLRTHKADYDPKAVLPRLIELVDCYQSAISIFHQYAPNDQRLGRCLNGVAFHYSGISMRGGIGDLSSDSAKRLAISHIEQGISLYSQMQDQELNVADCLITRGVCEGASTSQALEFFLKGVATIVERFGPFHPLLLRGYFNIGIYYQELGNIDEAYTYFHKWYQLLADVFGSHHPRTLRAGHFLTDGLLKTVADKRGDVIFIDMPVLAGKKKTDTDGIARAVGTLDITISATSSS